MHSLGIYSFCVGDFIFYLMRKNKTTWAQMVHMSHEETALPSQLFRRQLFTLSLLEGRIRIVLSAQEAFRKHPYNLRGVFLACFYLQYRNPVQVLPCRWLLLWTKYSTPVTQLPNYEMGTTRGITAVLCYCLILDQSVFGNHFQAVKCCLFNSKVALFLRSPIQNLSTLTINWNANLLSTVMNTLS